MDARQIARALAAWWAESPANKATTVALFFLFISGLGLVFPIVGIVALMLFFVGLVSTLVWLLAYLVFSEMK